MDPVANLSLQTFERKQNYDRTRLYEHGHGLKLKREKVNLGDSDQRRFTRLTFPIFAGPFCWRLFRSHFKELVNSRLRRLFLEVFNSPQCRSYSFFSKSLLLDKIDHLHPWFIVEGVVGRDVPGGAGCFAPLRSRPKPGCNKSFERIKTKGP